MKTLEKVIKDAIAADKYKSGVKEVLQSVKGSKADNRFKSMRLNERSKLEEQAKICKRRGLRISRHFCPTGQDVQQAVSGLLPSP